MQPGKPSSLLKPTLKTKFRIDYEWWERDGQAELTSYLLTHLPPEQRDAFSEQKQETLVDFVDPVTGEVHRLDELGVALQAAARSEDFINLQTSLVDSVFRVFLMNGNSPLDSEELAEITRRDAKTILKTLGGVRVYKGIRPLTE